MSKATKSGVLTTEFWITVVFAVLQAAAVAVGMISDPTISAIAIAVLGGCYALARGLAKAFGVEHVPEIDLPSKKNA